MSLIEKIDAEIAKHYLIINDEEHYSFECREYYDTKVETLNEVKEIILSEQNKPKTKGDAIRESNESLASVIEALVAIALGDTSFIDVKRRLEWLNQPQEDTNE